MTAFTISRACVFILAGVIVIGLIATPAAATWGHLKGPFSPERQLRERLNYAAEQRDELRSRLVVVRAMPGL